MSNFLSVLAISSVFAISAPVAPPRDETRPNVVVILADDQGWGDLSLNGNSNLRTPRIDSLARDGAMFERFYVCPVCSPTRAEFLTGRYHPRGGVLGVTTGGERLDLDERTVAETFQAAGYRTAAFGKWHNGTQYPYHPNGRGFAEYYGFTSGHWGDYFSPPLDHNGQLVEGDGYLNDDLTDHALEFIDSHRETPFFCYLPYNTPHSPMQVPDRFYEKFADAELTMRHRDPGKEDLPMTRAALAMVENIDWNVGRVLDRLDSLGLSESTIVVYFSDNGPNSWRWNGGMRGRKGDTDEGGVRSPLLVRWPGRIAAGTVVKPIAAAIDLLPTLAGLAEIEVVGDRPLDGKSLAPLLLGEAGAGNWPDRTILSHWAGKVSARSQRYRLDHLGRLYDMEADPGQASDVAQEHPEVATRLAEAVEWYSRELLPKLSADDRPFPVGYPKFPTAWLPARDGVPHGSVARSAEAPNCSYFTNWKTVEDRITWDVEVATAGRYEVVLYYTCKPEDVGATIELGFLDAKVRGVVTEAHDPPPRGREHDRVERGSESYVKDFRPLRLGEFTLPKGRAPLTIRAVEVPGGGVIDLRAIRLTLAD